MSGLDWERARREDLARKKKAYVGRTLGDRTPSPRSTTHFRPEVGRTDPVNDAFAKARIEQKMDRERRRNGM